MDESMEKECELHYKPRSIADDGLGCVNPQIYLSEGQTKEEVLNILEQQEDKKKYIQSSGSPVGRVEITKEFFEKCPKPNLTFEKSEKCTEALVRNIEMTKKDIETWQEIWHSLNNNDTAYHEDKKTEPVAEDESLALWRRLSGVRPNEKIFSKTDKQLMNLVLFNLNERFSQLDIKWSENCLVINEAKTSVEKESLVEVYDALLVLTDETEATKIITDIVVRKLERLFV